MENNQMSKKEINLIVEKDESDTYFFVSTNDENSNMVYNVTVKKAGTIKLFFYLIAVGVKKKCEVNIIHKADCKSNCIVKAFAKNSGLINIQINSRIGKENTNVFADQTVDGVLFDETSTIKVVPSMFVDNNFIKTSHAVNVGMVDPEKMFYLLSRGIDEAKAIELLMETNFADLLHASDEKIKCLYNRVKTKFNELTIK